MANDYLLLILLFCKTFGQITNPINLSPNGLFDNVYDQQGNQYNLTDLLIAKQNTTTLQRSVLVTCSNTSYFNLYFEPGCGMDSNTDPVHIARRAVLCKVFEDISNFITSPLTTTGNKVNIWVRNIANISGVPAGTPGLSRYYIVQPSGMTSVSGILDNEIWKTIHSGVDSFANTVYPLVPNSSSTSTPGMFYHGMIAFDFTSFNWNTILSITSPPTSFDLYSLALHEIIHSLGFSSALNQNGTSIYAPYNYFNRYDLFLKNNANTQFLLTRTGCNQLYNNTFNGSPTILRPGCTIVGSVNNGATINSTICNNAIKFVGTNSVPVYTPICFEPGSSLSHFEDQCVAPNINDAFFVTSNAIFSGTTKCYLKPKERAALCDIGYNVNTTFGSSTTVNGFYNYGGTACSGITVAGINDGIGTGGIYTYTGNQSTNITINTVATRILENDRNATGFECLEDITAIATITPTFGTNITAVTFNSAVPGIHLLRYIPTNGTQKGNITYIYVYVSQTSDCAIPTACNFVKNSNFEQYSSLPTASQQLQNSCGWISYGGGSPEYFHANSTNPQVRVPANVLGYEPDKIANNKAYAGFYIYNWPSLYPNQTSDTCGEVVSTKLNAPLQHNTAYQLSFDVSQSDNFALVAFKQQILLTSQPLTPGGLMWLTPAQVNSGIFLTNTTFSSTKVGWETVVLNFTTGAISGEQYLYIGALKNNPTQIITPASQTVSYYYLDNVKIFATNGASFNMPSTLCTTSAILPNLTTYLSGIPTNGTFTGAGVTLVGSIYSFSPALTGMGVKTISYTYNVAGCPITLNCNINIVSTALTPTFLFNTTLCPSSTAPLLPTTSTNGITGTWLPATINNTTTANYTFTPTATQCATTKVVTVTITSQIIPTFSFATTLCLGSVAPILPTTTSNATPITGTWSPTYINSSVTGTFTFTFTPNTGQCATTKVVTVTITPKATPTFNFATTLCSGGVAPILPTNSTNTPPITGTWLPATISNTASGTYTFTPTAGLCATTRSVTVTITPKVTPTFNFATTLCMGSAAPILPTSSTNSPAITGTWFPATVNNTATGNYTFTPSAGICATTKAVTITVNPCITITHNGKTMIDSVCFKTTAQTTLSIFTTSMSAGIMLNGVPATASQVQFYYNSGTLQAGVTVNLNGSLNISANTPAQSIQYFVTVCIIGSTVNCSTPLRINTSILPLTTPIFTLPASLCSGTTAPILPTTSDNFITGTWSPATISNTATDTYTFTPTAGQCGTVVTKTITVGGCNILISPKLATMSAHSFCYSNSLTQTSPQSIYDLASGRSHTIPGYPLGHPCMIGGVPCDGSNVTISNVTPPFPAGYSINPNGFPIVLPNTLPFPFVNRFTFDVCPVATPGANCVNVIYDALIRGGISASYDRMVYMPSGSFCSNGDNNVIANDVIADCATSGIANTTYTPVTLGTGPTNCTLTEIGSDPYFRIDLNGNILQYSGSPLAGSIHTLTYKICFNGIAGNCQTQTARISVNNLCDLNFRMVNNGLNKDNEVIDINQTIVFPNPSFDGHYNILFNDFIERATFEVYNLLGQKIANGTISNSSKYDLQLPDVASGSYVLKISCNDQTISKQLIKK